MTEGAVAILIAGISLLSQGVNIYLHLRIRNAILEADKQITKERDERLKEFVLLTVCDERHHVRRQRA
jgi:hypothetical protein